MGAQIALEECSAVLKAIAAGLSNKEIARRVEMTTEEVEECVSRLCQENGITSRVELILLAHSKERKRR